MVRFKILFYIISVLIVIPIIESDHNFVHVATAQYRGMCKIVSCSDNHFPLSAAYFLYKLDCKPFSKWFLSAVFLFDQPKMAS